ncbi:hypothetical protein KFK14_13060 [Sphingobium phenoxybenzoativorans]|uniref:Uncharacterized protein n=1 Tax=Sphingobium phenoxybenzoativorans TaxID=1592790 RepID=A0A975PZV9_9SPHN|nr:hypothetical protein [Sphingobium phenoxybenzoativorans]QUT04076.1 hypothetical protein KFK14_13060 [Sphingobium phenoxybenzoativorans]
MAYGFGYGYRLGKRTKAAALLSTAIILPFSDASPVYQVGSAQSSNLLALASYSRSGAKYELLANGSLLSCAADAPGLQAGEGYWSRASITNLNPYSNTTSDAGWSANNVTKTAGQSDPVTGTDAALVACGAGNSPHYLNSPSVTYAGSGTVFTVSRLVKPITGSTWYQMVLNGTPFGANAYANFNLTGSGSMGTIGANLLAAGIQVMANGWYRIWVRATLLANSTASTIVAFINSGTDARLAVITSTATCYQTGAQAVASTTVGPIIVTGASSAALAADGLTLNNVVNGTYDFIFTFDDDSTQTISGAVVTGGSYTLPVHPTVLNRPKVKRVQGTRTA